MTEQLADPDSLLGMLQRGRGKGYLRALEAPPETVWPLLLECITNDPRVDPQCEFRDEYYADLVTATGMDLEPLRSGLRKADAESNDKTLFLPTLICLAGQHKSETALEMLCEYVSYGQDWEPVLCKLAWTEIPEALADIVDVVYSRAESSPTLHTEFEEAIRKAWKWYCGSHQDTRDRGGYLLPIREPWKTISRMNPRFAELFAGAQIDYERPGPPRERPSDEYLGALSLEDLFQQVSERNCRSFRRVLPAKVHVDHEDYLVQHLSSGDSYRMILAFIGLGTLGTPRAFEVLKSYVERYDDISRRTWGSAVQAIVRMPASLTLDTARRWFRRKEGHLQEAAGCILEDHATIENVPLLLEILRMPEAL